MRSLFLRVALVICTTPAIVAADARQANNPSQSRLGDNWITTPIQARYFLDADIKARTIDVTAVGGVVTLDGTLNSDEERRRAAQIASGVDGVRRVVNNLAVAGEKPPEGTSGRTETVARARAGR